MSAPPRERIDPTFGVGRWRAGAVADRLGLTTSTLRTWNRRYGLGPEQRPGTHRLYSQADIAELEAVLRLTEAGTPLQAAVNLVRAERDPRELPAVATGSPRRPAAAGASPTARDLVAAAWELNSAECTAAFAESLSAGGALSTWRRLFRPAMARLARAGRAEDPACMGAELVLTNALTVAAHRTLALASPSTGQPVAGVLLACAPGEAHDLGLLMLQLMLSESGAARPVMLGAAVPQRLLIEAVARSRPHAVVLHAHRPIAARPALLRRLTGSTSLVLASGPGWTGRQLPSSARAVDDLATAHRLLAISALGAVAGPGLKSDGPVN